MDRDIRIEMRDVCFEGSGIELVRDFSLRIERGQSVAFVGSSGSGKSTVLKLAAGLLLPSSGKVFFDGKSVHDMNRAENLWFRKMSGFVFQNAALWANQTIFQNLELPLKIHFPDYSEKDRMDRISELLSLTGYTKELHIRPARLSAGEQKIIAFVRAFLCFPEVLFLDEWEESLDDKNVGRLLAVIKDWKNKGRTLVFVSHNSSVIHELADVLYVIKNGNVAEKKVLRDFLPEGYNMDAADKGMGI